jgi:hypothetical protein
MLKRQRTKNQGPRRREAPASGLGYTCLVSIIILMAWSSTVTAASVQATSDQQPATSNQLPTTRRQPPATSHPSLSPIPVLAYYYIWFDVTSWERAKTDFPLLGRYSSDDRSVMQQHIDWAKAAGITGFVVSWKNTEKLDRRLSQLVELADAENFKLALIYQGLDFERNPLPLQQIMDDLDYFTQTYAPHPAFHLFEKPLVIWSGTWQYSTEEVARLTQGRRDSLLLLASEKNIEGYERLAELVDGDAYYWSSVNPETFPNYPGKLIAMGEAVHARAGLWIAPAAPGFDARLVGGTTVVDRRDGETLRREIATALQSAPDAIGLISWNEFSENSQIEPSENYGQRYLEVLMDLHHQKLPPLAPVLDFDSSEPGDTTLDTGFGFDRSRTLAMSVLIALVISSLIVIGQRRFKREG